MPPEITCRRVPAAEIWPLRHRILRPGLPAETARFDGDLDALTRHYAAVADGEPVVCLTLMRSEWRGQPAWQLRGMATDELHQGQGLGRQLLELAAAEARGEDSSGILWCNARSSAIGFYEKLGWRVISEPFDVPGVGPHVTMLRDGDRRQRTAVAAESPPAAAFIATEVVFLAAAQFMGGPPWVLLGAVACGAQVVADFRMLPLTGLLPAAGWLTAHQLTGNRELFFPYAIALAAHLAGQFIGRGRGAAALAGGLPIAMFLAIRIVQSATVPVLAVELAVAAAIHLLAVAALPGAAGLPGGRLAVTATASLLAYAGLAV